MRMSASSTSTTRITVRHRARQLAILDPHACSAARAGRPSVAYMHINEGQGWSAGDIPVASSRHHNPHAPLFTIHMPMRSVFTVNIDIYIARASVRVAQTAVATGVLQRVYTMCEKDVTF